MGAGEGEFISGRRLLEGGSKIEWGEQNQRLLTVCQLYRGG